MNNEKKYQFLDGFILKICGLVFMTIDHIGLFLSQLERYDNASCVLRCIGRLALPIFILLLVEGIKHTKNVKYYLLRLGSVALGILIFQIIMEYAFKSATFNNGFSNVGSPFLDLVLVGLTLSLLKRKDKYSFIAIIPIVYIVLSFLVGLIEQIQIITINWFPYYLRPEYSLLSLLMGILFYYSPQFSRKILKQKYNLAEQENSNSFASNRELESQLQTLNNIFYIFIIIGLNIVIYGLSYIPKLVGIEIETWSIFSVLLLIFYNGKRGYNAKWFKYGAYIYFPLHIIIIAMIFYIILVV